MTISERAQRILNVVLILFFVILIRLWHLSVVQYDDRLRDARRPQRRLVIERAERGTIRDRFNKPLAINRVQYNAAVLYSEIRELPRRRRREYIERLSSKLSEELGLDRERIEDLIHSKAALFPNTPYVLSEGIDERVYYRLRGLEHEWPGLFAERTSVRHYPMGRVACDLLGYMGSISKEQYEAIVGEIRTLRDFLEARDEGRFPPLPEGMESVEVVCARLAELRARAYSIRDHVGKGGVELRFDEQLRGYRGRKLYLADIYGNYLRRMPGGQPAIPGKRVILSISAELQEFAEELLAGSEERRDGASSHYDRETGVRRTLKQPWIKGGAIVAMDPKTGELLAMASYPRFDPEEFLSGGRDALRWFETASFVGRVWDQKEPLRRERFDALCHTFKEEELELTWRSYLRFILPPGNPARLAMERMRVDEAVCIQRLFSELLEIAKGWQPREIVDALYCRNEDLTFGSGLSVDAEEWLSDGRVLEIQKELSPYLSSIPRNYDKLLLIDLCRLAVDPSTKGSMRIDAYRDANAAGIALEEVVRNMAKELFHDLDFRDWRERQGKLFLKEKRKIEREEKRVQKPYLDYFDKQEKEMFVAFWEENRWTFVLALLGLVEADDPYIDHFAMWGQELQQGAHRALPWFRHYELLSGIVKPMEPSEALAFCQSFRSFTDLEAPLLGRYRYLRGGQLKDLAAAFYPRYGFGFSRSFAFRQATPLGSVFKLITAYEGVRQHYVRSMVEKGSCSDLTPFRIVDELHRSDKGWNVGKFMNGRPIPMYYKGGRIIPTLRRHVGEIGLVEAMEVSSNVYFGLLVQETLESPSDLARAAREFSFGARTGIDLPGEYPGRVPDDLDLNPSGAYALSIGQHSLVCTPLQTAVALSAIANGGKIFEPKIVSLLAGQDPLRTGEKLFFREEYTFKEELARIGVGFPLFTAADGVALEPRVEEVESSLVRKIDLEEPVRDLLLRALRAPVMGDRGGARPTAARSYRSMPWMVSDYIDLKEQIVGKTSTAEIVENVDLDADLGTNTYNHIWFAGVSFEEGDWDHPELVVVVYLRFADYGKESAPLAAQIIKRWREIKAAAH